MSVFEVDQLVVSYGGIVAVRGVSLTVDAGEVVALLGPNGAGKSSFVNGVCGLAPTEGGSVRLDGEEVLPLASFNRMRRGIAEVPEGRRVVTSLTVEENLLLGLDWSPRRKNRGESLKAMYKLFPSLEGRKHIGGAMLSGGEQQMLAIARAMIGQPKVLLLDEPSVGLSPSVLWSVMESARRIADEGVAVLLAEQAFESALDVADRGYVLGRGEIVSSGSPDDFRRDESVLRTFLGVSVLPGEESESVTPPVGPANDLPSGQVVRALADGE